MQMKKIIYAALLAFCFTFIQQAYLKADWNFDPKLKFKKEKDFTKEKIERDYNLAKRMHL